MSDKVAIDGLNDAIQNALHDYGEDAEDAVKDTVKEVSKKTRDIVKSNAPVRKTNGGDYKKSISDRQVKNQKGEYIKIVYSKAPHYRLTHLLEHGHLTRNGMKKTRAFPHFKLGDDYINENFENKLASKLKQIK